MHARFFLSSKKNIKLKFEKCIEISLHEQISLEPHLQLNDILLLLFFLQEANLSPDF